MKAVEIEVDVCGYGFRALAVFEYSPAEPQTHDYPGCDEEFAPFALKTLEPEVDLSELLENDDFAEHVAEKISEAWNNE